MYLKVQKSLYFTGPPVLKLHARNWVLLIWCWPRIKKEICVLKLVRILYICYKNLMYLWAIFSLNTIFSWRPWFTLIERNSWKQSYCLISWLILVLYMLIIFWTTFMLLLQFIYLQCHSPWISNTRKHKRWSAIEKRGNTISILPWRFRQWHWDFVWLQNI